MAKKNVNVILVGSNPLPCYIQAAYVLQGVTEEEERNGLKQPDMIVFVVTNETAKYAESMKDILISKGFQQGLKINDYRQIVIGDIYSSSEIESSIQQGLEKINKDTEIGHILLNNTGGTKTMAVYATAAVRAFAKEKIGVTECFVDPIKNKIRCYNKKNANTENFPKEGDLRELIELSIEEMVAMHYDNPQIQYDDLNGKSEDGSDYVKLTPQQFAFAKKILDDKTTYKLYERFFRICKKEKKEEELERLAEDVNNRQVFESIKPFFLKEGAFDFKQLEVFTHGKWLEKYFYEVLFEVKEEFEKEGIKIQTAWSYEITPEGGRKNFEVDVLVLRGYALTLFSISMADGESRGEESMAKGKYFEAVYRVEQMSGEHGKAVVVNFFSEEEKKLQDFVKDLQAFNKEVKMINKRKLGNIGELKKEIRKILE